MNRIEKQISDVFKEAMGLSSSHSHGKVHHASTRRKAGARKATPNKQDQSTSTWRETEDSRANKVFNNRTFGQKLIYDPNPLSATDMNGEFQTFNQGLREYFSHLGRKFSPVLDSVSVLIENN